MDKELKLLIAHSKVLANEDLDELKDSNILDKFKDISLVKIYQGKENFKPFNKLIRTLNLFFTYDMDLYDALLDFLVNSYVLKLNNNAITLKEALNPVMIDIKKKLNSEGLSNYLFTGDTRQLQPFDIFRSVELLSTVTSHFQKEEFTSFVVTKGLSFLTTKEDMRKMFTHLKGYPFAVRYGDLIEASIDRDNVVFLEYLVTEHHNKKDIKNLKFNYKTCIGYSASKGSLNCLKYARENGCPWDKGTCSSAAFFGHLDCLKYAFENGCPRDEKTCSGAAYNGHLDCLKYAHENGFSWDERTCENAAEKGSLDCLKYAHENGCPWNKRTCRSAAKKGSLDCLKYAHENGCPWNRKTTNFAATHGHLDCLKYAHENGCPWDEGTPTNAAWHGHLDCLKYAHENGCPWDKNTRRYAAYGGHSDCLQYTKDHGL